MLLKGVYSDGDPPLPIPNREVKPDCADGTALVGGRVGSCLFRIRAPVGTAGLVLYVRKAAIAQLVERRIRNA